DELGQRGIPVMKDQALNERDYGDLVGLNKDDARKRWGEEQVHVWRRSYDVAPPGGESLRDTAARVLPYYIQEILPRVLQDKCVQSCTPSRPIPLRFPRSNSPKRSRRGGYRRSMRWARFSTGSRRRTRSCMRLSRSTRRRRGSRPRQPTRRFGRATRSARCTA